MHRWAAHLMVVSVTLHMIRVFYHGAYKPPREFNWVVGVLLFFVTLFLSFTGYLLPWDQIALWAITVGTNLAPYTPLLGDPVYKVLVGGGAVAQATLIRFYVGHVILLPLAGALLMAVHFWRIRKDGVRDALERILTCQLNRRNHRYRRRQPQRSDAIVRWLSCGKRRSPASRDRSKIRSLSGLTCWCASSSRPRR